MNNSIDLKLIRKFNVNGPRYTSYPTALQFADIDEKQYLTAVAGSEKEQNLSLYFHIPFCATLCYYCACSKIVTRDRTKADNYLELLLKEIELQAPHFQNQVVTQLHWGGGTPTYFDDQQVDVLMDSIRTHFRLADDDVGEFGIEIDPRTVDPDRIFRLRKAGFNRLSMGIQDFDPVVQKAVNRKQPYDTTATIMQTARDAGFRSISVDLIYGLPFQTLDSISRTLEQVITLSPDRISIYNYAHLPDRFTPQKRINVVDLPSADKKIEIFKLCLDKLTEAGYCYIGMDHFAKPEDELAIAQKQGTLQRNFQGYSTFADCDMVAMGVTSISQINNTYSQNVKTLEEYEALINAGTIPVQKGIQIDEDDQIRKAVIMALICQFTLNFETIEKRFNIQFTDYFDRELQQLQGLASDDLLTLSETAINVTDQGKFFIRNICMVFDRHLNPMDQQKRYSKAI